MVCLAGLEGFDPITLLKVILLAIVEGITEWLPISSTGHMIVLEELLDIKGSLGPNGDAVWDFFMVVIQLFAVLAVVVVFFKELWPWLPKRTREERKEIYWTWLYIVIGCLPAGIFGILLDDLLDQYLYNFITVSITLIVYGAAFILLELYLRKSGKKPHISSLRDFTWKTALIIGIAQVLSLIPGTSRSGVTILAALLIGVNRETSAKFSFYVSIPVMAGASLIKGIDFFGGGYTMDASQMVYVAVGCLVAFLVSLLAVKWLTGFVKKHTFMGFGIYRIALGVVLIILFCTVLKEDPAGTAAVFSGFSNSLPELRVSLPCLIPLGNR